MKKSLIILFALIIEFNFFYDVSAEEISLNYPEEVFIGEEFEINLTLENFSHEIYNVKIEILNRTQNIAQRFWNNYWNSTYYWIYNAINLSEKNNETFKINITKDYTKIADINVTIADAKITANKFVFEGYHINVSFREKEDNFSSLYKDSNESSENNEKEEKETNLEINYNDREIVNGEEFEIKIKAFNLQNQVYDFKIWIELENNESIISERYDRDNEEWKSGKYYVNNFFNGAGNKSEKIMLRIRKEHDFFTGNAKIFFRLRDGSEYEENIEILKKEDKKINETNRSLEKSEYSENASFLNEIIHLSDYGLESKTEDIKTKDNVVYESENELIKKYSIYGFASLCVLICIFLIFKKIK